MLSFSTFERFSDLPFSFLPFFYLRKKDLYLVRNLTNKHLICRTHYSINHTSDVQTSYLKEGNSSAFITHQVLVGARLFCGVSIARNTDFILQRVLKQPKKLAIGPNIYIIQTSHKFCGTWSRGLSSSTSITVSHWLKAL